MTQIGFILLQSREPDLRLTARLAGTQSPSHLFLNYHPRLKIPGSPAHLIYVAPLIRQNLLSFQLDILAESLAGAEGIRGLCAFFQPSFSGFKIFDGRRKTHEMFQTEEVSPEGVHDFELPALAVETLLDQKLDLSKEERARFPDLISEVAAQSPGALYEVIWGNKAMDPPKAISPGDPRISRCSPCQTMEFGVGGLALFMRHARRI